MATGVGDLEAVVLAAGAGVRFGGGKLVAPFEGRSLVDAAVDAALAAPVRAVTVVTGADPRVAAVLAGRPVRIIEAADHALGLAHSLRAGLAALPEDTRGAFVFLGDMPRIPHGVIGDLAAALTGPIQAAAPVHRGRRGHPVLLHRDLFPRLLGLAGDAGAQGLLATLGARLSLIKTEDEGVLLDIDDAAQLASLAKRAPPR